MSTRTRPLLDPVQQIASMLRSLQKRLAELEIQTHRHRPGQTFLPADLKASARGSADDGWLAVNQSIANADTTYPELWDAAPGAWKSGSTLNIPNYTAPGSNTAYYVKT